MVVPWLIVFFSHSASPLVHVAVCSWVLFILKADIIPLKWNLWKSVLTWYNMASSINLLTNDWSHYVSLTSTYPIIKKVSNDLCWLSSPGCWGYILFSCWSIGPLNSYSQLNRDINLPFQTLLHLYLLNVVWVGESRLCVLAGRVFCDVKVTNACHGFMSLLWPEQLEPMNI